MNKLNNTMGDNNLLPGESISLACQPIIKNVGGYDITGGGKDVFSIKFMFTKKPNFFHRACCKFFLGWVWVDEIQFKKTEEQIKKEQKRLVQA